MEGFGLSIKKGVIFLKAWGMLIILKAFRLLRKGGNSIPTGAMNVLSKDRFKLEEIFQRLAYPFPTLIIDRVEEVERGKVLRATKWVSANEFFLAGHFPGEPIMPGVLTLEGLIQCALLLIHESFDRGILKAFLQRVDRVRFKRAILPGDRVEFSVTVTAQEEKRWKFSGRAKVGEETAAEADLHIQLDFREVGFEI